jgi:23S rRNA (cytosine1962-C5)-methyltransferase
MDPPSYGRGTNGEVWKLEENLYPFLELVVQVLSDQPLFLLINSYTTGLAPSVLTYLMETLVSKKYGGHTEAQELGLPVTESGLVLPCGASGRWSRD